TGGASCHRARPGQRPASACARRLRSRHAAATPRRRRGVGRMLSLPPAVRIFLCTQPTDMRKSFDTLAALVRDVLAADRPSAHLFAFPKKLGARLKLLFWDSDGYVIYYKRLEEGSFQFPAAKGDRGVEIRAADLAMLLDGVDLDSVRRRKRYRRPVAV